MKKDPSWKMKEVKLALLGDKGTLVADLLESGSEFTG